jgi:glycosyltransferase involved in cell wall biosynthesis
VILQTQSELMLYPTHFNEMFCISALECLSVGTPVISSKRAAMCERISHNKTGIIIDGNPKSILYKNNFIKATVDLLKNSTKKNTFAIKARADNEKMNFNNLAKDWERELQNRLNKL